MKEAYTELLGWFCRGKKMSQLQNSWFLGVNLYFDEDFKVEGISSETVVVLGN